MAASSMKVYKAGWNRYQAFARLFQLAPQPITTEKVTLFIAFLGTQGLAPSTIESYLAGLRHFRLTTDPSLSDPSIHSPYVNLLLKGIRRTYAAKADPLVRLPVTISIMDHIKKALAKSPHSYEHRMVWAACCVGFFGFLRCSEFLAPDSGMFDTRVHLCLADLRYVPSQDQHRIELRIKASKTDQLRKGTTVSLGATNASICPVAALLDFLGVRGRTPGPLFVSESGSPLSRRLFVQKVQSALTEVGLPGKDFNGHSFRIGAATSASQAGVPETTIKILGRWNSLAYQQYIRPSGEQLASVSRTIISHHDTNPPPP